MTTELGLEKAELVVELGPGTGAITEAILPRLAPGARLVAVELNPGLAARLSQRFPGHRVDVVQGSAADLTRLVSDPVDVVVSGLPWTVMAARDQQRILDAVAGVLSDTGRFSTFAYAHAAWTPPARRFAQRLGRAFAVVERSRVIWPNLPPAFVYRATAPRSRPVGE